MKCSKVQNKLLLYQERALPMTESEAIKRHIRSCVCCSAVASELAELERIGGFALATSVTAPSSLDSRVMAAIRAPSPPPVVYRFPLPLSLRLRRLALAALVLIIATGVYALLHWSAFRGVNERIETPPAPTSCNAVPSMHALPRINGRIVDPAHPALRAITGPPPGMAANGHMRKHGPNCRCWEAPKSQTPDTAP
jgi:hypothetical protein